MFTHDWLKRYGHTLNPSRAIVIDENGVEHRSGFGLSPQPHPAHDCQWRDHEVEVPCGEDGPDSRLLCSNECLEQNHAYRTKMKGEAVLDIVDSAEEHDKDTEREQPTRQLVDNRKLLARTKAVRQTTGRAPTELILPGQD